MSIDGAKALAAKVLTDEALAKQLDGAKTAAEFDAVVAKLGYSCTAAEFDAAFKEAQAIQPISDDQLDQAAGGLSIPRKPGEIIDNKVLSQDGDDLTEYYHTGAVKAWELVKENKIKVAILKEDSPSCGVKKIYDGTFSGKKISGQGITTRLLSENGILVLDEIEGLEYLKNL